MTLHEVTIAMSAIEKRMKQEIKFKAACMGATFKDEEEVEDVELTPAQEAAMARASQEQMDKKGLKHV